MQKDELDERDLVYTFGTDEENLPRVFNDILQELVPIAPVEPGFEIWGTLALLVRWRYACEPSIRFMDNAYRKNSVRELLKSLAKCGVMNDNDWPFQEEAKEPDAVYNLNVVYMRVLPNVQQLKLCLHDGKPFLFLFEQELVLGVGYDDTTEEFTVCRSTSDDENTFSIPYDHPSYQESDFWFLD
jgi:hypothetical protein